MDDSGLREASILRDLAPHWLYSVPFGVSACAVHHEPVRPAVAYRVDTPDGSVVISGDTRTCAEIAASADEQGLIDEIRQWGYRGTVIIGKDLDRYRLGASGRNP